MVIQTDLRTLQGQSVVDLQPGHQPAHFPRSELVSCGHIDQILHHVVSAHTHPQRCISTNYYLFVLILVMSNSYR